MNQIADGDVALVDTSSIAAKITSTSAVKRADVPPHSIGAVRDRVRASMAVSPRSQYMASASTRITAATAIDQNDSVSTVASRDVSANNIQKHAMDTPTQAFLITNMSRTRRPSVPEPYTNMPTTDAASSSGSQIDAIKPAPTATMPLTHRRTTTSRSCFRSSAERPAVATAPRRAIRRRCRMYTNHVIANAAASVHPVNEVSSSNATSTNPPTA